MIDLIPGCPFLGDIVLSIIIRSGSLRKKDRKERIRKGMKRTRLAKSMEEGEDIFLPSYIPTYLSTYLP